jgi:hypothetical protein
LILTNQLSILFSLELTMGMRKSIAQQLTNAAKALESDKSKEKIGATIFAVRVGLANAIMPKMPITKR